MPIRSAHRHLEKGLTHPNRWVAAATWLLLLLLLLLLLIVLIGVVKVVVGDFWLIILTWMRR